ncbi:UbiA family prenyltransferase [Nocardioides sp. W3-2-3]|uniref:UbiA family prenyltransferase n=1 Tax=Nocardioides convexus TaxID=2712224 RepID=UPI0024188000|nr:UbiA family prenyltransferase [Nocardioides convexus]NHA01572.1 UbiA family prenyltransferase [Nocardioides convexus]
MGLAAAVSGRPARETAVVLVTVLVGQTILGWHNDIVDRQRDKAHGLTGKPVAMGRLTTDTLWYAVLVAALLLVPLAITTGIKAGCLYLASVAVGLLGNVVLRTGFFSWWSWAVSFALLPAYLSFGGWGGQAEGNPPETSIVVLAALLGIGVHFMRAVWGLVADHEDGWTYLPLRLGLKTRRHPPARALDALHRRHRRAARGDGRQGRPQPLTGPRPGAARAIRDR